MESSRQSAESAALPETVLHRLAIRELIENWIIWRDSGDWDRFATLWHDDARMCATWFEAPAGEFVDRCRKAFDGGLVGLHSLGGSSIDVAGTRAVAQTRMQIVQRARVHGVLVDVTCQGRFIDALEYRGKIWALVLRQPVYELDRMACVDPAAVVTLEQGLLLSFPEGYRHLAYLQTELGFDVRKDLPGTRGAEIQSLMSRMTSWLAGGAEPL